MKSVFEKHSPNSIVGDNLLTEHVHPNVDGYFLMADAFYNSLIESSLLGNPDTATSKPSGWYRKNWGYTALDSLSANLFIRKLKGGWPFQPDTVVNSFIRTYKPVSYIDSLAYQSVRYDDISLESAHKTLAKYYLTKNQPQKAISEYKSILKSEPYKLINYIEAGDILFNSSNYREALDIYKSALRINRDNYLISKIGETYALLESYDKAIGFLEEVHRKQPDFRAEKVIGYLHKAYSNSGQTDKANDLYANNKHIFEKHSDDSKSEVVLRLPPEVSKKIQHAIRLLQSGSIDQAYDLLIEANQINETNVANRFLGDILLMRKDINAMLYLKKVYTHYKTDPEYLNTLCYACILFKDYAYAAKILPELKRLSPGNPYIPEYERVIAQNM
jgi:tetratricopeptide (TPR) repeat protein